MTQGGLLRSGGLALRRAAATDLASLVALQRAAYAKNRPLLGVEPIPLLADYAAIMRDMEVWVSENDDRIVGALILEPRADDLLIWSIAADPATQGAGLGRTLLAAAEERARQLGRTVVRLYTGTPLAHLVAWYGRHGYTVERIEALSDRSITHMIKHLGSPLEAPGLTKSDAMRIALSYLEAQGRQSGCELALQNCTIEKSFGWIFFYQSKRYLETGDIRNAVAGNAPIVVAKSDGRIHVTGTGRPLEYYLEQLAVAEGWNTQE